MTVTYTDAIEGIGPDNLHGFFEGWPNPPSPADHLRILEGSDAFILAVDADGRVVGWISAITDGVSCVFIPHLEVLPAYRGNGIGSELVRRIVARFSHLYAIDLSCDPDLVPFYQRLGFSRCEAMVIRNIDRQDCGGEDL